MGSGQTAPHPKPAETAIHLRFIWGRVWYDMARFDRNSLAAFQRSMGLPQIGTTVGFTQQHITPTKQNRL